MKTLKNAIVSPLKPFKTLALSVAVVTVTAASISASADVQQEVSTKTAAKQAGVFSTSTVVGTLLGGPVGFVIGSASGAYLANELNKADQLPTVQQELAATKADLSALETQLVAAKQEHKNLKELALNSFQSQIFFRTNGNHLNEMDHERLDLMASFLRRYPEMTVRLSGFSDPRGTDADNYQLSRSRVEAVKKALESRGIEDHRMEYYAFGEKQSKGKDFDSYAKERRVNIEIFGNTQDIAAR